MSQRASVWRKKWLTSGLLMPLESIMNAPTNSIRSRAAARRSLANAITMQSRNGPRRTRPMNLSTSSPGRLSRATCRRHLCLSRIQPQPTGQKSRGALLALSATPRSNLLMAGETRLESVDTKRSAAPSLIAAIPESWAASISPQAHWLSASCRPTKQV
jgi:hypothetical protein